jgi:hypothetical protein
MSTCGYLLAIEACRSARRHGSGIACSSVGQWRRWVEMIAIAVDRDVQRR